MLRRKIHPLPLTRSHNFEQRLKDTPRDGRLGGESTGHSRQVSIEPHRRAIVLRGHSLNRAAALQEHFTGADPFAPHVQAQPLLQFFLR